MTTHDDLIRRATNAYLRWCRDHGCVEQQPSSACSYVEGDTLVLENQEKTLARYRLLKNGRLRKISDKEWAVTPPTQSPLDIFDAMYHKATGFVSSRWIRRAEQLVRTGLSVEEAVDATIQEMMAWRRRLRNCCEAE